MHRINKELNACCVLKGKKKIELKRVHIVNDCNIQTVLACINRHTVLLRLSRHVNMNIF